MQEILPKIEIKDLTLYLKSFDALIFSDVHIGYEEALNKKGILIPRLGFQDIKNKLKKTITRKFKFIIINGDLKHEFGTISKQEWSETKELLKILSKYTENLILIKGNHDTILEPILKQNKLEIIPHLILGNIYITHGNNIPKIPDSCKTIIIGHEHPAISIREHNRVELYKCFLKGKFKNKNLIVMPSLNPIAIGTDILKEKTLSPFLKQDLKDFEVYIVEDKVYYFGKIKDVMKM